MDPFVPSARPLTERRDSTEDLANVLLHYLWKAGYFCWRATESRIVGAKEGKLFVVCVVGLKTLFQDELAFGRQTVSAGGIWLVARSVRDLTAKGF